MVEVISLEDFKEKKKKKPDYVYPGDNELYESLETVLDTIEEHADYGFVLLEREGSFISGATTDDMELLISMLEDAIDEMKERVQNEH
jgi:peptide subunit release factor 1 (eRF1)